MPAKTKTSILENIPTRILNLATQMVRNGFGSVNLNEISNITSEYSSNSDLQHYYVTEQDTLCSESVTDSSSDDTETTDIIDNAGPEQWASEPSETNNIMGAQHTYHHDTPELLAITNNSSSTDN